MIKQTANNDFGQLKWNLEKDFDKNVKSKLTMEFPKTCYYLHVCHQ